MSIKTPELDRLDAAFHAVATEFRGTVMRARHEFGPRWEAEAELTVGRLLFADDELAGAVRGYVRFCREIMRLQVDFQLTGKYAPKTYTEATAEVYSNDEYMRSCYLPGLLLSWLLWPHQYRQLQFFREAYVPMLARAGQTLFYDIGVGTGLYSRLALTGSTACGIGFDISPEALAFSRRHVNAFAAPRRYRPELRDVREKLPTPADWLICVDLIEHLPDPLAFLRTLRKLLRPRGHGFIATAINAPNADHIYLYRNVEEVRAHLCEAGFVIEQVALNLAREPRPGFVTAEVAAFIVT